MSFELSQSDYRPLPRYLVPVSKRVLVQNLSYESELICMSELFGGTLFHMNGVTRRLVLTRGKRQLGNDLFSCSFHCKLFSFVFRCNPAYMGGNFGQKLQNCPKMLHIHIGLYCFFYCNNNITLHYIHRGYYTVGLTSERSERVRYCSCHENIKFISSSICCHVSAQPQRCSFHLKYSKRSKIKQLRMLISR